MLYSRSNASVVAMGVPVPIGDASGQALVAAAWQAYRAIDGTVPFWAILRIVDLFHSDALTYAAVPAGQVQTYGGDYVAGGPGHDTIFGQLGDDTLLGDGALADPVAGAVRNAAGDLVLAPSVARTTDGDDYVEGGGGNDVIFGGLGQDDLIGGSSSLFSLDLPTERPDGADRIFGGAGVNAGYNAADLANGDAHGRDADTIAADNADIFRIVGTGGAGAAGFTSFNYDDAYGRQLVVRAVRLLDYTAGGPDFEPTLFTGGAACRADGFGSSQSFDRGGADEVHGEAGDDTVYTGCGNDVIYGDGGDDDLIGGWGHDWISGGTGTDGVLGDDGRIMTSRNGTAEPLYGVVATTQTTIASPGRAQEATINVTGLLNKAVDLTPYNLTPRTASTDDPLFDPQHADDVIFGGLGDDFLHGGAGDDAISGAEALLVAYAANVVNGALTEIVRSDWSRPFNGGDLLHFGDGTRGAEFALYDEFNPMVKVLVNGGEFFLNFDHTAGPLTTGATPANVNTDGNDIIFGDLGNDWLVGGTGRDSLWGGWGNDLMNADDRHDTNGGLNDQPDTNSAYEDRAFGGAGIDVLIGNTGGDRLIDWVGEFDSYVVPFAPFGLGTVSRQLAPGLKEFLYALSKAQGADPTRTEDGGDPARNGEPNGEIGLVTQQDTAWQDQTGGPTDPQPGNIPGGDRDVLRSADFNNGTNNAFLADSGVWQVSSGRLAVASTSSHSDAVAVFYHDAYLPVYYEVIASITTVKPTGGWNANAYVIFDYFSPTDFKFAGINVSTNKFEMGVRDASGWSVVAQQPVLIKPDVIYSMLVAVNGTTVTVSVDGAFAFTWTFPVRIVDGVRFGLNQGLLGAGSNNARGTFDNVAVRVLPPAITLDIDETFDDGQAQVFTGPSAGAWTVMPAGRYETTAGGGATNAAMVVLPGLSGARGVDVNSYLELTATVRAAGIGGIVFDRYAVDDFKFAGIDLPGGRVVVGHHDPRRGWVVDAAVPWTLVAGADYVLLLTLKGASMSISVGGQLAISRGFNAALVDGAFGTFGRSGLTSFDRYRIRTNDPFFAGTTPPPPPPPPPATPAVAVAATDGAANEAGSDAATFVISRTGDATLPLTVNLTWGGAATFGTDYSVSVIGGSLAVGGGMLTLAAGSASATLVVTPFTDALTEGAEGVVLTVAAGSGYTVTSPGQATATIADNPPPPPPPPPSQVTVSVAGRSVSEGRRDSTLTITLTLSAASAQTVTVRVSTQNGTALAGSDYTAVSNQLVTFAAGQTTATIGIRIIGDTTNEPNETFTVVLSQPSGAVVGTGTATVTLLNDDGGLTAATQPQDGRLVVALDADHLAAVWAVAVAQWADRGVSPALLGTVTFRVVELPGAALGLTEGTVVTIDATAAGWGWHLDPWSPVPIERIDLLTVVLHELGHAIGFHHSDDAVHAVMAETLSVGMRVGVAGLGEFEMSEERSLTAHRSSLGVAQMSVAASSGTSDTSGTSERSGASPRLAAADVTSSVRAATASSAPMVGPAGVTFSAADGATLAVEPLPAGERTVTPAELLVRQVAVDAERPVDGPRGVDIVNRFEDGATTFTALDPPEVPVTTWLIALALAVLALLSRRRLAQLRSPTSSWSR